MGVPVPLDQPVKILELENRKKLTHHQGAGHLSLLVQEQVPQRFREKGEPQVRMMVHAVDGKID